MSHAFALILFTGSSFYLGYGYWTLEPLTDTGRPGPGFFPLIVGGLLTLLTGLSLVKELSARHALATGLTSKPVHGDSVRCSKDTCLLVILIAGFILILKVVGAILAMMLFMLTLLAVFNRGRHLQNLLYSTGFPLAVYALFELWLRAGLPQGPFSS
ncbi:tripartite tricarboxylate transporter TctB family protein [Halomonas cupida]|uniref:tripartite tricarboxylate transporter TctB family protein n=1 Tax=Halomonas cupida TaxID=44933 RepID=UPI003EF4B593